MATTIERAFELAQSGRCRSLVELRAQLRGEGFYQIDVHLGGKLTRKQLQDIMNSAR